MKLLSFSVRVTAASFVVVESGRGKDVNQETHRVGKVGKRLEEVTEEWVLLPAKTGQAGI